MVQRAETRENLRVQRFSVLRLEKTCKEKFWTPGFFWIFRTGSVTGSRRTSLLAPARRTAGQGEHIRVLPVISKIGTWTNLRYQTDDAYFSRCITGGLIKKPQWQISRKLRVAQLESLRNLKSATMPDVRRSFITTTVRDESKVTPQGRHRYRDRTRLVTPGTVNPARRRLPVSLPVRRRLSEWPSRELHGLGTRK